MGVEERFLGGWMDAFGAGVPGWAVRPRSVGVGILMHIVGFL